MTFCRALSATLLISLVPVSAFAQVTQENTASPARPTAALSLLERAMQTSAADAAVLVQAPKPAPAAPQMEQPAQFKQSHWGVSASFTPQWKMWDRITKVIADESETWAIEGKQFTIGAVHGRSQGGDFGVDYTVQPIKDGSTVSSTEERCTGNNGSNNNGPNTTPPCFTLHSSTVTDKVKMAGVKVHFFIPFVTIKKRVQVGINIGAGAAQLSGNVVTTEDDLTFVPNTPPQQGGTNKIVTSTTTKPVKDVFELPIVPLFDLDIAVAFIISPAIKVRYQGGVGIPGQKKFQILGYFLFGAH